ncbi:hypothetical protein ACN47E_008247 [Coniothyrium glycines]
MAERRARSGLEEHTRSQSSRCRNDDLNAGPLERKSARLTLDMYSSLPREIRNRVYAYCTQGPFDNEVIVRRTNMTSHQLNLLVRKRSNPQAYHWVEDPFTSLLDGRNVETSSALEMVEAYFWTRTFKFDERQLECLGMFLTSDLFQLQMIPAHYVRNLHIQIRPLLFAMLNRVDDRRQKQQKCCNALMALARVQTSHPKVAIIIDLAPGSIDPATYMRCIEDTDNFLSGIMRIIVKLKERGLRIELVVSTEWDESHGTALRIDPTDSIETCMEELRFVCKDDQPTAHL